MSKEYLLKQEHLEQVADAIRLIRGIEGKLIWPDDYIERIYNFTPETNFVFNTNWEYIGEDSEVVIPIQKFTSTRRMFSSLASLEGIELKVTLYPTHTITDMSYMFNDAYVLTKLDVSSLNTAGVTNMNSMFYGCNGIGELNLSNFNTSSVTDMSGMFGDLLNLNSLNLSNFNTSNVTNMSWMFDHCSSLTILDLSSFDMSNVTNMRGMFDSCHNLITIYVKDQVAYNKLTTLPTNTPTNVQFVIK